MTDLKTMKERLAHVVLAPGERLRGGLVPKLVTLSLAAVAIPANRAFEWPGKALGWVRDALSGPAQCPMSLHDSVLGYNAGAVATAGMRDGRCLYCGATECQIAQTQAEAAPSTAP